MTRHDTSTLRRAAAVQEQPGVEAVRKSIAASYVRVQYEFVQFFTEHVVDSARGFDHDLEQMVVMAVLGQRMLQTALPGLGPEMEEHNRVSMTASRIADVTGLLRETVRRKLVTLSRRGWIAHDPRHGWHVVAAADGSSPARDAFSDFELRFQRRLARLYVRLSAIIQSASEPTIEDGPAAPGRTLSSSINRGKGVGQAEGG